MPWPFGSCCLLQPAACAATSMTRRRRPVSTGYRSGDSPWFQVSPSFSGLTTRGSPMTSSRKSFGSRPAAAASSATNDWIANAWGMFETDRNQPIRVWAIASGFSMRTLGIAKGTLMTPIPSSSAASFLALTSNVEQIVVARPRHLDGLAAHGLRQHRGLDSEVRLGLASEAAAEQRDVHGDVVGRHAQALRDQIARGLRRLEAAPY